MSDQHIPRPEQTPEGETPGDTETSTASAGPGDPQGGAEGGDLLDPEPLAMDMDDVLHAFDPDRWTPDDPHDEDDYPFIESDVQAPPG